MYPSAHRGRGGRFRGRGRFAGPIHRQVSSGREDVFSMHPKSKFQRLGVGPSSIHLEEVGFYSLYGDTADELQIRSDRSLLRTMTVKSDSRFNTARNGRYIAFDREMPILYQWLEEHAEDDKIRRLRHSTQILASKSLLSELIKLPYDQDGYDATGYIFGAAKIGNKVILGKIQRPNIDRIFQKAAENIRDLVDDRGAYRYVEEMKNHFSSLSTYRHLSFPCSGRRYEVFMTTTGDGANSVEVGVDLPRYRSVMDLRFRDINLLIETFVDGIDPKSPAPIPGKYVDFTTMKSDALKNQMKLYRERLFRWWTNSIFIGVENAHVGVHEYGVVNEVHTYRVADIPRLVKEKEEDLHRPLWNAETALGFMHGLLKFVLRFVVLDHKDVVYEITAPKECGEFICSAVPAENAVGHVYIPENANTFIF